LLLCFVRVPLGDFLDKKLVIIFLFILIFVAAKNLR